MNNRGWIFITLAVVLAFMMGFLLVFGQTNLIVTIAFTPIIVFLIIFGIIVLFWGDKIFK